MWSNTILRRVIHPGRAFFSHREYSSKIFISRLSFYTTDDELRNTFSQFGQIKEDIMAARLIKDPRTNRPKGYGFVEYSTDAEAEKAIKSMDGKIYGGRLIFVEHAKSESTGET
ncbi:organelle RRM domain-containing protein 6, chloroplastic-like isoform X1 [Zingiber officinale]|uniref:organelle RRM domain-containing protein 6, chloroplastic-like isoform X1 n=1 Tax=Zingiber officinale TaxID=94328 RepID=UPI001C4A9968|nr:organelle RRM domain-containing protein 6, chloroplastic-like isoform X1 [Zingiber officinale]XP_042459865.1 organelle RRM domain-containing protein 6, chloroplastic-like isoform X1 [Zingiber officinale]XP_042459866.1 organelle RRM domain-containing protein 6, chloroplastic-like isoform X1 [Zingiber officinale]